MILTPNALAILKNFAAINSGIFIEAGSTIRTVSKDKDMLATAIVDDVFPVSFGLYDLNEFLSVLSLHKEMPEIEFDPYHIIISGLTGRSKIKYRLTDKQMILTPPDKKIKFPATVDFEFEMNSEDYVWINNAAKVLKSPNIAFNSDGTDVRVVTFDANDSSKSIDSLDVGIQSNGSVYNLYYKTEVFAKLFPGDYDVKVAGSSGKASHYVHKSINLNYYVMFEANSVFG